MAQLKWKLNSLHAMKEATFGTDPSANGSLYTFLYAADMTFNPTQDVIERMGMNQDLVRQAHAMGAKAGSLAFKLELKGSGTPAIIAVPAIGAEADPIFDALFGTVTRGTGSTVVAAGSTTSVVNFTSAAGVSKYMLVFFDCGATYGYVPRFITSIAANAVTLDRALPVVPTNGASIQASTKYTRANTGHASLAFVAKRDSILYNFLGCKIDSAKISGISARGFAVLDITCSVTDFNTTAKANLPATELTGITAAKPPIVKGSCFAVGGTEEHAYSIDLDFAHKFEFMDSTCALGPAQPDSANAGLEMTEASPGGSIHAYQLASHLVDFFAGTERSLMFAVPCQPGATGGNGWGFYIPKAQWQQPSFEAHQGMVGQVLPFKVNDNVTDPEYSFCVA